MLILKDEHAIDVLKSGNTGHLWHDFHAIGVHATDVGHPEDDDEDDDDCDEDGKDEEEDDDDCDDPSFVGTSSSSSCTEFVIKLSPLSTHPRSFS